MNKRLEELATEYMKNNSYAHVKVDDSWYRKTEEYKVYLAGYQAAIKDAAEVIGKKVSYLAYLRKTQDVTLVPEEFMKEIIALA